MKDDDDDDVYYDDESQRLKKVKKHTGPLPHEETSKTDADWSQEGGDCIVAVAVHADFGGPIYWNKL